MQGKIIFKGVTYRIENLSDKQKELMHKEIAEFINRKTPNVKEHPREKKELKKELE